MQKLYKIWCMLTQEDKEEIARIFDNGIGKKILLIRIAMEQIDAKNGITKRNHCGHHGCG